MKVKVITSKKHRAGKTIQYGEKIGKISFDENCIATVTEEQFEALKQVDASIDMANKPTKDEESLTEKLKKENADKLQQEPDVEPQNPDDADLTGTVEGKELVNEDNIEDIEPEQFEGEVDLKDLKLSEMQEIAKEAGLPEEEWGKIRKRADFIKYLEDKSE